MTEVDGIRFDSRKEAARWCELKLMERSGCVKDLKRQVKFNLIPVQRKNGKVVERGLDYIADFVYLFHDGKGWTAVVEDVKGIKTDVYKIKRKLMLWRFGIEIVEV